MIELVTYPANLADWQADGSDFYIELFGETQPVVDMTYAEVFPKDENSTDSPTATADIPIYQYWWTIGQSGSQQALELRQNLQDDPAARVYLYFPLGGGWRIKEFVASVKYLTPIKNHVDWLTRLSHVWNNTQPFVDEASQLAQLLPAPLNAPGPILNALAKLKLNDVPPVDGFAWSVGKVTAQLQGGVMEGVMWTLPKRMFTDIGGRITGSLAVSFIPAPIQEPGKVKTDIPVFEKLPLRAHARIYLQDNSSASILPPDAGEADQQQPTIHLPDQQDFIELLIQPILAQPSDSKQQ